MFSYDNSPEPYMLEKIVMKTTADPEYEQELVRYEYYTEGEAPTQAGLLKRVLYRGENTGIYFRYGSWDPDANGGQGDVVMLEDPENPGQLMTWMKKPKNR